MAPRITNPSQPAATLPIWSTNLPEFVSISALVASSDKVVLGKSQASYTDTSRALCVLDAKTGQKLREDNDSYVDKLALSPDGLWLATSETQDTFSGPVNRVRILNLDTGDERCRLNADSPGNTSALTFSPDGRSVALAADLTLVFDAASGAQRWRTNLGAAAVAWSPGSESVAVGYQNGVSVHFANDGSQRMLVPSPSAVDALVYSQDGSRIVAGCADGTIFVFDATSGVQLWSAQVGASRVVSVAISDDQRWVAVMSGDKVVGVYDLTTRGTPRYPPVACSTTGNVLFSGPTLRHIIASGGLRSDVIDARTGHVINTYAGVSCFIPPDGGAIAVADSGVQRVERYDLGVLISERDLGTSLALIAMSPAGAPLVAVTDTTPGAGASVTVIDAANGNRLANKPVPGQINGVTFADASQAVVTASPTGVRLFSVVGDRSWTLDTTTIGEVKALASAGPAGEMIAIAAGKTAQLLSSADGQSRWTHTQLQTVTRIAASRDGKWIATGCADRITRILDAQSGAEIFTSVAGGGAVSEVAFQPNTSLLGSSNLDTQVLLINAANPTQRGQLTRHFPCRHIAFSFDTTMLAVADDNNTVAIYDITTVSSPQLLYEFGFAAPITALAFNPADNSIAAAIGAKSVVVHDPRSGIELTRILHPQPVRQFSFSADGALIATASDDGTVRVWAS